MSMKPGSRWKSRVCDAEAVVVRPARAGGLPQCGGVDMAPLGEPAETAELRPGFDGGCIVGKRYRDEAVGIELLCTKAGAGSLGFGDTRLAMVEAKQLPSSD
ncbi:hypothetical protein [Aquibium microcysteis]|uniref:hypothetical protein n=1 Tax=Aquibium microcysteis TaxID=675281 RepID=UPI00165D2104|nr:hypothetical protein [Aquibium microcysteis]